MESRIYNIEKTLMITSSQTLIIAHRGASAEAPENTLAAIRRAIALNAHYVEIDVRLSKEGIPVVLHDPSAARMIGDKNTLPVRQLTLSQIKKIAIGQRFGNAFAEEKIPTLQEVLGLDWKNTGLMIEIKKSIRDPKVLVDAVFRVLSQIKKPLPKMSIGSFSLDIVKEVQKQSHLLNSVEVIGIVEKPNMIAPFIKQKVKRLALWYKLIKEENMEIWTFTVDDLEIAKFLISLDINGIISNNPRMMMKN
jgi:glycerophosphoryl diester phosphodiesterase